MVILILEEDEKEEENDYFRRSFMKNLICLFIWIRKSF